MKAFLSAVVVAIVIAVGAAYVLDGSFQRTAFETNTRDGVRMDAPGHNLMQF